MRAHAAVAQLVEQRIRNAKVASSTPASGTIQEHLLAIHHHRYLGVGQHPCRFASQQHRR